MTRYPIDVSSSGAILLGDRVCCDGFHRDYSTRVQTHIHLDHMEDFETSKGFQDLLMTRPTKDLLTAEFDADLPFRANILCLEYGQPLLLGETSVLLLPNGHMLGSAQVSVCLPSGARLGYSGDFQWPIDTVIQVDALVVDSTYGSPDSVRKYSQDEAERRLLDLTVSRLRFGPIHLLAHRGTLQRALQLLTGSVNCPILGSPRLCKEVEVFGAFGYAIGPILRIGSSEAKEAIGTNRYLRVYGYGDQFPVESATGTTITLSAYMSNPEDPVLEYSERSYRVALSNHADFQGTLDYIAATGAKYIVTDNTRGGHAVELAQEIRRRLGLEAQPSSHEPTFEWGI